MNKIEITRLPLFFNYKEEGTDNGYESIQDFFLSWTLRCADEKTKELNPKLHEYAKHIVFILIHGYNNENDRYTVESEMSSDFRITNIKTLRQFKTIDLIAEIEIEENSLKKKYVFNIENKFYTSIGNRQLEDAKENVKIKYNNSEYNILNFVIFCDDAILYNPKDNMCQIKKCKENEYKFLTIENIKEIAGMQIIGKTQNALFDEFWFYT